MSSVRIASLVAALIAALGIAGYLLLILVAGSAQDDPSYSQLAILQQGMAEEHAQFYWLGSSNPLVGNVGDGPGWMRADQRVSLPTRDVEVYVVNVYGRDVPRSAYVQPGTRVIGTWREPHGERVVAIVVAGDETPDLKGAVSGALQPIPATS